MRIQFVHSLSLAGHEDWIRGLSFCPPSAPRSTPTPEEEPLILASGSQDNTIRLWNISLEQSASKGDAEGGGVKDDLLDDFEAALADVGEGDEGRQVSLKRHVFGVKQGQQKFVAQLHIDILFCSFSTYVLIETAVSSTPSHLTLF